MRLLQFERSVIDTVNIGSAILDKHIIKKTIEREIFTVTKGITCYSLRAAV